MKRIYVNPVAPVSYDSNECIHTRSVMSLPGVQGATSLYVPPFTPVIQVTRRVANNAPYGPQYMPVTAHKNDLHVKNQPIIGVSIEGVDENAAQEGIQTPETCGLPIKINGPTIIAYPYDQLKGVDPSSISDWYGKLVYIYPNEEADFVVQGDVAGFKRMRMGIDKPGGYPIGTLIGKPHDTEKCGLEAHITVFLDPFINTTTSGDVDETFGDPSADAFADLMGDVSEPPAKKLKKTHTRVVCTPPSAHLTLLRCCAKAAHPNDKNMYASWLAPHGENQLGNTNGYDVGLVFSNEKLQVPKGGWSPAQALFGEATDDMVSCYDPTVVQHQVQLNKAAEFQSNDKENLDPPVHSMVADELVYTWDFKHKKPLMQSLPAMTLTQFCTPTEDDPTEATLQPQVKPLLRSTATEHNEVARKLKQEVEKLNRQGWGCNESDLSTENLDKLVVTLRQALV